MSCDSSSSNTTFADDGGGISSIDEGEQTSISRLITPQQAALYLYTVAQNIVALESAVLGTFSNVLASNAAAAVAAAADGGTMGGTTAMKTIMANQVAEIVSVSSAFGCILLHRHGMFVASFVSIRLQKCGFALWLFMNEMCILIAHTPMLHNLCQCPSPLSRLLPSPPPTALPDPSSSNRGYFLHLPISLKALPMSHPSLEVVVGIPTHPSILNS